MEQSLVSFRQIKKRQVWKSKEKIKRRLQIHEEKTTCFRQPAGRGAAVDDVPERLPFRF
jgi:hypothetical protein